MAVTRIRMGAQISVALGVLSLLAMLICSLALTDIYHLEADVTAEWRAVQICFGIFITFQVSALVTLSLVLRYGRETLAARPR